MPVTSEEKRQREERCVVIVPALIERADHRLVFSMAGKLPLTSFRPT